MSNLSRRQRKQLGTMLTYFALCALSAVFLLPFVWMVSSAFKTLDTVFEYPPNLLPMETLMSERGTRHLKRVEYRPEKGAKPIPGLLLDLRPGEYQIETEVNPSPQWVKADDVKILRRIRFRWENFVQAWTSKPFTRFLFNTVFITVCCIVGQVLTSSLVAFGFSRLQWPGRNLLFMLVLATMMLPGEVTMIPTYLLFRRLGWIDTFLPLIVPSFLGGGAFSIFLFRQFFMTLPRELDEAARIDGCNSLGVYRHVLMPLCKPIVATIAVFAFVGHWNDFLNPLIYLNSSDKYTLAVGLRFFQGAYNTDLHLLMAASTLVLIPVLIVFFLGQKHFVKSIVLSGVKG
jgi:multiple sugar transport system permease protein